MKRKTLRFLSVLMTSLMVTTQQAPLPAYAGDTVVAPPEDDKTLADDWYNIFEWELDDEEPIIYLNSLKATDVAEVEIPATATIDGTTYSVWLSPWLFSGLYVDRANLKNVIIHEGVKLYDGDSLFSRCTGIEELDLSGLDTGAAESMDSMFSYATNLKSINLDHFDTSHVESMYDMFQNCESLEEIDLSSFATHNVTSMADMFNECASLKELDLSSFDTRNVESMYGMFDACSSLNRLNISSFNTDNVERMDYMFARCEALDELNLSHFNTANVTEMEGMFYSCPLLTKINLSSFNTANVTDMNGMFNYCESLKELDLSNFDMSKVVYTSSYGSFSMFTDCDSLAYIKTPVNVPSDLEVPLPVTMYDRSGNAYNALPNGEASASSITLAVNWDMLPLNVKQADSVYGEPLPDPVYEKPEAGGKETVTYTGTTTKNNLPYGPTATKPTLPGEYTVNVYYEAANYNYSGSADFVITKANRTDYTQNIQTPAGQSGSFDFSEMLAEGGRATLTVTGGDQLDGTPAINGTVVSWKVKDNIENINVTLNIAVTRADNYNDYNIKIYVTGYSPLTVAQADGVYGTPISAPEYTKPAAGGTETLTYTGKLLIDGSAYGPSNTAPTLPGSYTVNVLYKTSDKTYAGTAEFVITKADWASTLVRTRGSAGAEGRFDIASKIAQNATVGAITVVEGGDQLDGTPHIDGSLLIWKIKEGVEELNVTITIPVSGADNYNDYTLTINILGGSSIPAGDTITLNGTTVASLKEAFRQMTDPNTDYVVNIGLDVKEAKNLTIPKTAKSVTINGCGHTLELVGGKITANAPLSIEQLNIKAVKKNGASAKFTLTAKKDLKIGKNLSFSSDAATVKCSGSMILSGALNAKTFSAKNLTLDGGAVLTVPAGANITISGVLSGKGGVIELASGFSKPVKLNGTVDGKVTVTGAKQADGCQIFKCSAKKISAETLKNSFDVSAVTDNDIDTYLYYFGSGKACIFGESISYNGQNYGVWKDAITAMNADLKAAKKTKTEISFAIELNGNVNVCGSFKLPSKGYSNLTLKGNGHSLTFTSDVKLTGNTVFEDVALNKVDKKGNKKAGKVIKGKFSYTGPETF